MSPPKVSKNIKTRLGTLERLPGNIVLLNIEDNIPVDMEIMVDVIDGLLECFPGQKFFVIADARKILTNATIDSLNYAAYNKQFNKYCAAQAVITDNLAISLIANFYASILKRNEKVKLVKNMPEAEAWLKGKEALLG